MRLRAARAAAGFDDGDDFDYCGVDDSFLDDIPGVDDLRGSAIPAYVPSGLRPPSPGPRLHPDSLPFQLSATNTEPVGVTNAMPVAARDADRATEGNAGRIAAGFSSGSVAAGLLAAGSVNIDTSSALFRSFEHRRSRLDCGNHAATSSVTQSLAATSSATHSLATSAHPTADAAPYRFNSVARAVHCDPSVTNVDGIGSNNTHTSSSGAAIDLHDTDSRHQSFAARLPPVTMPIIKAHEEMEGRPHAVAISPGSSTSAAYPPGHLRRRTVDDSSNSYLGVEGGAYESPALLQRREVAAERYERKLAALMQEWGFKDRVTAEAYYVSRLRQRGGQAREQSRVRLADPDNRLKVRAPCDLKVLNHLVRRRCRFIQRACFLCLLHLYLKGSSSVS